MNDKNDVGEKSKVQNATKSVVKLKSNYDFDNLMHTN